MGINIDTIPTPRPAKTRPTTKRAKALAPACIATPTKKTMTPRTTDHRLPRKSANGAAIKAPKNVPADKIETTRDCWAVVIEQSCVATSPFPKVHNQ